ncbi:MAG: hypothetical protein AB1762_02445 [Gemmatimonadota bacterium]
MTKRLMVSLVAALAVGTACASGGSAGGSGTPAAGTPVPRGSANLITEAEIVATGLDNLYEVVERLRPNMLRTRGQVGRLAGATEGSSGASSSAIKVYLNGTQIGDTQALRSIQARSVKSVQYLSPSDATTRFGTGVDAGAIVVTSK